MKERIALQNYCLEVMGITRWVNRASVSHAASEDRANSDFAAYAYLVFIDTLEKEQNGELSLEKQQLLERMLKALQWPNHMIKTIFVENNVFAIEPHIKSYLPKKILLFNLPAEEILTQKNILIAKLPSLQHLLSKPESKKQAWAAMRSLVGI